MIWDFEPDESPAMNEYLVRIEYSFLDESPAEAARTFWGILEDQQQALDIDIIVSNEDGDEWRFPFVARSHRGE